MLLMPYVAYVPCCLVSLTSSVADVSGPADICVAEVLCCYCLMLLRSSTADVSETADVALGFCC